MSSNFKIHFEGIKKGNTKLHYPFKLFMWEILLISADFLPAKR